MQPIQVSSLLIDNPRTYANWWTFIPVLPSSRETLEYEILKRQWADHTMNCLSNKTGLWKLSSSRGFYVERREDHITTVLFHIWALFPDTKWVGRLLDLWQISHSRVTRARWSYSWEQKRDKASRPDICDIVLCYEDETGQGVVVVEAKRPGGALSDKDLNGGQRYLELPSLRSFRRRRCVFLVDEHDKYSAISKLPSNTPVTSWQAMGRLQTELSDDLPISSDHRARIGTYIARHYADLSLGFDSLDPEAFEASEFTGTHDRYRRIQEGRLPSSVERFLLGAEVSFCARTGRMPQPPFAWLAEEPSFVDVVKRSRGSGLLQTTQDREKALWRLP
jgi:hypothetical protein